MIVVDLWYIVVESSDDGDDSGSSNSVVGSDRQ